MQNALTDQGRLKPRDTEKGTQIFDRLITLNLRSFKPVKKEHRALILSRKLSAF
jgi:hypothetical protein